MAKQIYIDSNGNEVLVSGTITNDNNLPHFSGTPTAGTTAYEIKGKLDASKIYARNNNGTIASGAIGSLSYPTGFDNNDLLFISCKYASGKLFFALPQLGATTYNIYFRDGSATLPSGDYAWYELWVKANT